MINPVKAIAIGVGFFMLSPLVTHAGNKCVNFSPKAISQAVSSELDIWGGRMRMLDLMSGEKPVVESSAPMYYSSISSATKAQKDKQGESITLGEAFPIYTINPEKLLSYKGEGNFLSLTEFTGTWFVPAFIDNRAVAIIEAGCVDNQLKVVSVGAKPVVEAITSFNKAVKLSNAKQKRFVRLYQPMSNFFATEQDTGEVIYPLTFSEEYLAIELKDNVGGGYAPENVLTILSNQLKKRTN